MKKLARNWRNSGDEKFSLPTRDDPSLDDSRPMDTQESVRVSVVLLRCVSRVLHPPAGSVSLGTDWLAVLACSLAIIGLLHDSEHQRLWIWYSCSLGLVLAVFWLYYMLSGAAICLYVEHLLSDSSEEVRKLRGYMYAYKAS
ncbi:hypothetical protein Tsubulata_008785 [Turnera subulata]|uniref:Uncharacterized protein n=1 Tax=Turnera subulata TaxID=218843 RepID=A0A9Q0JLL6_9ROSI|nr:hypothetical protein Tsubulata_008785 [Turnera subulata]